MKKFKTMAAAAVLVLGAAGTAHAEATCPGTTASPAGVMCGLATMAGKPSASALGISGDGRVAVGHVLSDDSLAVAVQWTSEGTQRLGAVAGDVSSSATATDADGSVAVGWVFTGFNSPMHAIRWTDGAAHILQPFSGAVPSMAYAVNADGSVVVGQSGDKAVRWADDAPPQDLGALDGTTQSVAYGVSGDGSVVVGQSGDKAFRWTQSTRMRDLTGLTGTTSSAAYGVSGDGSVVVGQNVVEHLRITAVKWADNAAPQHLAPLQGQSNSSAMAVNADGSVVVGWSATGGGADPKQRAVRWVGDAPPQDLGALDGTTQSVAYGVSGDGSVVVGSSWPNPETHRRAFIWKAGGSGMEDTANLLASFARVADANEAVLALHRRAVGRVADRSCVAEAGGNCVQAALDVTYEPGGDHMGARSGQAAVITYGRGVHESVTVGLSLAGSLGTTRGKGAETGLGPAIAFWARIGEAGAPGAATGLQAEAGFGYGRGDAEITRGKGLTNVHHATGDATVDTTTLRAGVGYGLAVGDAWVLTPKVSLTYDHSERDSYRERGGSFNARYADVSSTRLSVAPELTAASAIGARSHVALTGGVEFGRGGGATVKGTSDLPGRQTFAIGGDLDRNLVRPFAEAGYTYAMDDGADIGVGLGIGLPEYGGDGPTLGMSIAYTLRF